MHTKAIRDARKVSHEARPPESNSGNGVHIFSPDYPTRVPEGGVAANTFPPRRYQIWWGPRGRVTPVQVVTRGDRGPLSLHPLRGINWPYVDYYIPRGNGYNTSSPPDSLSLSATATRKRGLDTRREFPASRKTKTSFSFVTINGSKCWRVFSRTRRFVKFNLEKKKKRKRRKISLGDRWLCNEITRN